MTAGLPGLGLSGLFMLLTALLVPAVHAARHGLRGHDRRTVRLFTLAAASVLIVVLVWAMLALVAPSAPWLFPQGVRHAGVLAVPAVVISSAILIGVLVVPEVLLRTIGSRPTPALPPVPAIGAWTADRSVEQVGPFADGPLGTQSEAPVGAHRAVTLDV